MFLKFDPYRVWCSIFYSKLVNCILFKIIVQHVRFVKGRGTCGSGKRNVKIWIDFRKSPRFSLTLPLSQEREKSSRPGLKRLHYLAGLDNNVCPIVRDKWKRPLDKWNLLVTCPSGQVKQISPYRNTLKDPRNFSCKCEFGQ
jgi:hypothetical protein